GKFLVNDMGSFHFIMPTVPDIIRMPRRRRALAERGTQGRLRRFALVLTTIASVGIALGAVLLALAYNHLTHDLPSLKSLPVLLNPADGLLRQPTRILDRTGQHVVMTLENPVASQSQYLLLEDIPQFLQDATIAAADPTFWQNPGYSLENLNALEPETIAQILVFDLMLWDEPGGLRRNLRARLLAAQLTRHYGREQVLEWYLNSARYGHLAYGADAAAWVYFGKSATELTLAEAALLATVSQAPDLNPLDAPDLALERRQQLLQNMLDLETTSPEEISKALDEPLGAQSSSLQTPSTHSAFLDLVFKELSRHIPRERLERGGLKVITTLDYDLQLEVDCAVATQLARLSGNEIDPQTGDTRSCETARLLPTLAINSGDHVPGLSANAVVLAPRSGQVLAMVGADDSGQPTPRLVGRAPGSFLAPYVYLTAFTRGFSPASLVWDIPAALPPGFGQNPNIDGEFHGPMRMRVALANDYLVPTLQLLNQLGPENVWKTAAQLGLPSLGASTGVEAQQLLTEGGALSLLEAAHAFGVFSTQGILLGYVNTPTNNGDIPTRLEPTTLLRVVGDSGRVWVEVGSPQARPVISAQLAYLIAHVLSDEAARWPSLGHPNALEAGRPAGVKIGYTASGGDAWTVGFTPDLVVGIWAGYEENPTPGAVSPNVATSIWHAILQYAARGLPPEGWPTPAGISNIDVCDPSGLLPTIECPIVVKEVFTSGNEPTHLDTLFRKFQINRETGLLATVFTPPALIEERVYMVPPPEAAEWAQRAGLPIPPETYDLVSAPPDSSLDVQFHAPEMFAYINGQVSILGTAAGPGFQSYRVQIGQGLNPQQWLQIGDEVTTPVEGGELAVWDTRELSGLYAIRLLVVREDQRVETAIIQVTVDNQPPEASILYPEEAALFTYPQDRTITLQASASDDLGLDRVEIYVDDNLAATFTQPPFALAWNIVPGEHALRVQTFDLAGNSNEAAVTFSVRR
ncbi:MAG: penicillin-binding protein, partial [Anaerolineales bacterium]